MSNFKYIILFVFFSYAFQIELLSESLKSDSDVFYNEIDCTELKDSIGDGGVSYILVDGFKDKLSYFNIHCLDTTGKIIFDNCNFLNRFELETYQTPSLVIKGSNFFSSSNFSKSTYTDSISIKDTKFFGYVGFNFLTLPRQIRIQEVEFLNSGLIDFTTCRLDHTMNKCTLILKDVDVSNMVIPYSLFELDFDDISINPDDKMRIYEGILNNCQKYGLNESYKNWDIKFKKDLNLSKYKFYSYDIPGIIVNELNGLWWNFRYEKWRIFWIWLPFFFLLFSFTNFFIIGKLVESYCGPFIYDAFRKGSENNQTVLRNSRLFFTFFYTANLYFGFNFSVSDLKVQNLPVLFYIMCIYLIGSLHVIFGVLGYILN